MAGLGWIASALVLVALAASVISGLVGPHIDALGPAIGRWLAPALLAGLASLLVLLPFGLAVRSAMGHRRRGERVRWMPALGSAIVFWNLAALAIVVLVAPRDAWARLRHDVGWMWRRQDESRAASAVPPADAPTTASPERAASAEPPADALPDAPEAKPVALPPIRPPEPLPRFADDETAVRWVLERAMRGYYDRFLGTDEHLADLSECLTRRGAAAIGCLLASMEVSGLVMTAMAGALREQTGLGSGRKIEEVRVHEEQRVRRIETMLARYGVDRRSLLHEAGLLERLTPRGRAFLLDVLPYHRISVDEWLARDEDPAASRADRNQDVEATSRHSVERARLEWVDRTHVRIVWPANTDTFAPAWAVVEEGAWRIDWPGETKPPR